MVFISSQLLWGSTRFPNHAGLQSVFARAGLQALMDEDHAPGLGVPWLG